MTRPPRRTAPQTAPETETRFPRDTRPGGFPRFCHFRFLSLPSWSESRSGISKTVPFPSTACDARGSLEILGLRGLQLEKELPMTKRTKWQLTAVAVLVVAVSLAAP